MSSIGPDQHGFAILDHVPMGICVLREDGAVVFWNRCVEDWTGLPRGDMLGTDVAEHFPHLREPKYWSRLDMIFRGGPPAIFSSQLHRHIFPATFRGGELRIQHTTVTSLPAPDGRSCYALFVVEDVTELTRRINAYRAMRDQALQEVREREKIEQEKVELASRVQQADKMKSLNVMAGAVAHKFNNILMVVTGCLELAIDDVPPEGAAREAVEDAHAAAKEAAELSALMLTYVGRDTAPTDLIDLAKLAEGALGALRNSVAPNITCETNIKPELPPIQANPNQLRRILNSLVANALHSAHQRVTSCFGQLEQYRTVVSFNERLLKDQLSLLAAGKTASRKALEAEEDLSEAKMTELGALIECRRALLDQELSEGLLLVNRQLEPAAAELEGDDGE